MSRRSAPPLSREPTEVVIDGFTHGGEGVARIEGKAVFVPGALPDERVVVRVVDDRARWARAELVDVVAASPDRVPTPVADVAAWGGCDLLHVAPMAARELKTRVVREQLQRIGRLEQPPVEPCRAVGPDRHYRNHVQLHAAVDGSLGFHRAHSHEVVPADRCPVMSDAVRAVLADVGADTGASRVVLRAHPATGTAAVVLTPGPGPLELPGGDADLLLEQPDGSTVAMRGDGILAERVADLTFRFHATSFFQVNTAGAAALIEQVLADCGEVDGALTWDLYAGVGLLSLPLARAGADVLAVEGHAASAAWAGTNAEEAGLPVTVVNEPVADVVGRAAAVGDSSASGDRSVQPHSRGGEDDGASTAVPLEAPDVVVLDPPRVGAGEEVITGLAALGPATIVYVACDVAALARDTRYLGERGYRMTRAVPLDLFPLTHHVEVVASFQR